MPDIQVFLPELPERHDTNNINSIVNNTFWKVDWLRHVLLYWPEHVLRVPLCKSLLLSEVSISLSSLLYDLLKYGWEGRAVRLHNLLDITALSIIILPKAKDHLSSRVCSLKIQWPLPVAKVEPKKHYACLNYWLCWEFSFFKKIIIRNEKKGCLPLWKYPSVGGGCKENDIKSFEKLTIIIIIITFSFSHDTTLALPILHKGPEPTENLYVTFCPNWWSKTKKAEAILVSQTTPSTFEQILNFYTHSLHQNDVDFTLPFLS